MIWLVTGLAIALGLAIYLCFYFVSANDECHEQIFLLETKRNALNQENEFLAHKVQETEKILNDIKRSADTKYDKLTRIKEILEE